MSKLLTVVFVIAAILHESIGHARGSLCFRIFDEVNFVAAKESSTFAVNVPEPGRVLNQCSLGVCHLMAWVSAIENGYRARNGKELKLSPHFSVANYWLMRSLESLDDPNSKGEIRLEANLSRPVMLLLKRELFLMMYGI